MPVPTLDDLPAAHGGNSWPWTDAPPPLPDTMPDGGMWPRISIVTPSYNQGQYIEETLRSVILQGYPNLEYVVIDGGSMDGSVDTIRKYGPWLTYWVSEKDRGQSHAINKGLAQCTGEIFNWLNSDDVWCPGTAQAVAEAWVTDPPTIAAGTVVNFSAGGRESVRMPHDISLANFIRRRDGCANCLVWDQPGTFLPLAEVQRVGGVREDLRFGMDHLLMVELLKQCRVRYVDDVLARFRLHEASKTTRDGIYFHLEIIEALRRMPENPIDLPRSDLRAQHASTLIGCASAELRKREFAVAGWHLVQAACLSPFETISRFRDWLGRRLRRLSRLPVRRNADLPGCEERHGRN